mgnify:CR=1 FL=1
MDKYFDAKKRLASEMAALGMVPVSEEEIKKSMMKNRDDIGEYISKEEYDFECEEENKIMASKLDFMNRIQLVSRRRRPDLEQLEYPDCYTEYVGTKPTGRIIRGLNEVVYDANLIKDENKEKEEKNIVIKKYFKLFVKTLYGEHLIDVYSEEDKNDINIEDYKTELGNKYKDIFVDSYFEEI